MRIYPATAENKDAPTADKYDISKKTPSIFPAFAFKSQIAGAINPKITNGTAKKISDPSTFLIVAITPMTGAFTSSPNTTPAIIPKHSCGSNPNLNPPRFSAVVFIKASIPYIHFATHASTSAMDAVGSKRATTAPSRATTNLVKFHLMSELFL